MKNKCGMLLLLAIVVMLALVACDAEKMEPETQAAEPVVIYRVWVLTEADTPVKGAMVQLCRDVCIPAITNEDGEAVFSVPEDDYKVSIAVLPKGYEYADEVQEFLFEDGSMELTIRLKKAS